jgi:aldehyde dehydrogenase (NAD+)
MEQNTNFFNTLLERSNTPPTYTERLSALNKMLCMVQTKRASIKQAIQTDFKKPDSEIDFTEIIPVLSELRYVISKLKSWIKPVKKKKTLLHINAKARVIYQPKGVVLIIAPWNYPFSLCIGPLISAIAAGNRVVIKPSEFTPTTASFIKNFISEIFPSDWVSVQTGGAEVSELLTKLPFNHIFFTGSPAVGKLVMKAASEHLTSVTLELGGKSPCLLDFDYSATRFAQRVVWGKFINAGQTCIAPDYLLIPESRKDEILKCLIDEIQLRFSNELITDNETINYTRIINQKHTNRLEALLDDAVKKGARLHYGGSVNVTNQFIPPTIISNISNDMKIDSEEIFGPILPIYTFNTIHEAVQIIQSKPRPLATYVFTNNSITSKLMQKQVVTGAIVINDVLSHYIHKHLPFGGVNNSGIGRSHGYSGFKSFSNELSYLETGFGPTGADIIKQPYSKTVKFIIDKAVKYI